MSSNNNSPNQNKTIQYELSLSENEARNGVEKILFRNGRRLQVKIPAGLVTGNTVKLSNALQTTDNYNGDILVNIKVDTVQANISETSDQVIEINDITFSEEVLKSKLPVVVDFWAAWCGPCRMMSPVIEQGAKVYAGIYKFCKINVDENQASAAQYQAMSIPMLLIFKNGRLIDKSVGAISLAQLKVKLDSLFG
jgi:thioredoxin 1